MLSTLFIISTIVIIGIIRLDSAVLCCTDM